MIVVIKAKNKVLKREVVAYEMAKEKLTTTMNAGRNNFITSRKVNLNFLPKQVTIGAQFELLLLLLLVISY